MYYNQTNIILLFLSKKQSIIIIIIGIFLTIIRNLRKSRFRQHILKKTYFLIIQE